MDGILMAAGAARQMPWAEAPSLDDLEAACAGYDRAELRVAVLGPFNQGKSTLLNAVLGSRALPMDIVRATAGPIMIRHGPAPETRVVLADGRCIVEPGFDLLRRYATQGSAEAARDDVREVEARMPHPLLSRGVALVDLPGTGDTDEYDDVIRREVLSADVVVQVLNARQLLTLDERRSLGAWVLDRGGGEVIFAVNFLNLLDEDDRARAWRRAEAAAHGFAGASRRMLRVDALPALHARLAGDAEGVESSGLARFLDALSAAVDRGARDREASRRARAIRLAGQVADELALARDGVEEAARALRTARVAVQAAAQAHAARLVAALAEAAAGATDALATPALVTRFAMEACTALASGVFESWRSETLVPWLEGRIRAVELAAAAASDLAGRAPPLVFPRMPSVALPAPPDPGPEGARASVVGGAAAGFAAGTIFFPVGGNLVGAAVGGLMGLRRANARNEEAARARQAYEEQAGLAYWNAAATWLAQLGMLVVSAVESRAAALAAAAAPPPVPPSPEERELDARRAAMDSVIARLRAACLEHPARAS